MSIYDKASLVLIPSGTKTSKVYSQKPTNGDGDFTFSRSTAATRVNASGNIEKETQNLLLQSNSFDTTWLDITLTKTSGQAGYDGTNDAWKLDCNAASSRLYQTSLSVSNVQTYSVYAKAGTLDYMGLIVAGAGAYAYFDIANGQLGATNVGTIDHKIESIGGGWYRCSIAYTGTTTAVRIYPAQGDNDTAQTSGNIYIQDAQLEQGLVARDYIETTTAAVEGGITDDVPRLDYTDSSCPALLLEPQRTNLVNHSEYFGDSSWSKTSAGGGSNAVVTDNYGVSPEGLQNAARLQLNLNGGTSASDISYIAYYYAATGVATTNSVYMKSLSGTTNVRIRCGSTFESVDVTTDWQRFDVTDSSTSDRFQVLIYGGINSDTADLLIWGAQGEAGSYATSYIPTYGSAVTRNADAASKTGVSSLIGQSEGTLFLDFKLPKTATSQNHTWVALKDSPQNNRILVYFLANSDTLRAQIKASGTANNFSLGTISNGDRVKIAIAYKSGNSVIYVNGSSSATSTNTLSFGTMDIIDFTDSSAPFEGNANQMLVFPTRLSNEELATLTTI